MKVSRTTRFATRAPRRSAGDARDAGKIGFYRADSDEPGLAASGAREGSVP